MFAVGKTDIGKVRNENQDRYRICNFDDDTVFAVVCDGMGGAHGGSTASDMTSNCIYERIQLSYHKSMEPRSVKSMLFSSVIAANAVVHNKSLEDEQYSGMGTTCVAAVLHKDICCIASVGDSRAYYLDASGIRQITQDHTIVQYLHSQGVISEDEMKAHKMKNIITRAVGVEEEVEPDYFEIDIEKGSYVLICTDGLTNYLSDEMLYAIVYRQPLEHAVTELIEKANSYGGKDNITAVLIAV